jgi:hypothetical protein
MRTIDADKLVDMLYDNEFAVLCPLDEVSGVVDACPTVDAVVVTRCKDCYQSVVIGDVLYCTYLGKNTDENGYCHEGG